MMNKVSEAFVSGLITVLLERFLSGETLNLVVGKKLGPELVRRLRTSLLAAEALVADAEQKQFGNQSVRKWLDDLRDAVYKADDLLDRFCIKAATQKQVRTFLPSILNLEERQMVNEIEEVVSTIEDLEKCKGSLGLEKIPAGSSSWRIPSTSLVRGNVYGREDDQKALMKLLNDNNEHHLSVISIVGMGGVGKTTLAQWLYNNEDLMMGVGPKAWVCFSENFDVIETTKNVLKGIQGGTCCLDDFNSLQHALKEELSNKKFFIVLDDVWSDDGDRWRTFMTPFQYGDEGSIVLLTTRGENVALAVQNCRPYFLLRLSEDYCWSVFAENASFPQSNGNKELESIGRQIVEKCDGLPLAAESLGRLCAKHDVGEWNKILMSDIWKFSVEKCKIIPALLISYFHLPAHLKGCFVYCSLFPKDYCLNKSQLIFLWMAEDLLPPPKGGETIEEAGAECFDELTSRLFFTKIEGHDDSFVMHDLLHDLAIYLAGGFYCNLEELEEEEIRIQTRHLCGSLRYCSSKVYNSRSKVESLRTLLLFNDRIWYHEFNIETAICEILSKCKYLRALSFDELNVLPNSIGELIHLRYLNLSGTSIEALPESLCNLYNLQTLILYHCTELTLFPSGMHNLVNLLLLDIRETCLEEMPRGISKLKHLRLLDYFVVGKHEDNGIQELGGLSNLQGSFEIRKLENAAGAKEAKSARMMDKIHIDGLSLEWSSGADMVSFSNTQNEIKIMESLQPHNGLKMLGIKGYKGTMFPDWVAHSSYQNMTIVGLLDCKNCCKLPSLGELPSLNVLYIQGFDQLKSVGMEFYKNKGHHSSSCITPFPSLETLAFEDMASWEEWHLPYSKTFPQLRKLEIRNCPMLKGEMVNQVFLRIVSSISDVSNVCKLKIQEDRDGRSLGMQLDRDTLSIKGCKSEFKAISISHLSCLQEVHISYCCSAVSFADNCFPKSLQKLKISGCSNLEFPEQQEQHKYDLEELQIENSCDSLTSFSLDAFPNLKILKIQQCKNLKSVSVGFISALQCLTMVGCPELVSFAGEGLDAPNLTHLKVTDCVKLEALPSHMNSLLPCLESLDIKGCSNLCRLPEGGLPPNLNQLLVGNCKKQVRRLSGMGNFHTLTHFTVYGGFEGPKSYPEKGSLPHLPSLTTLHLYCFPNMKTLECNQLLPLTSLQHLLLSFCSNMRNMAGEKLSSSLSSFQIHICGLLGEHCKNRNHQIWAKISHIPTIKVDGINLFE